MILPRNENKVHKAPTGYFSLRSGMQNHNMISTIMIIDVMHVEHQDPYSTKHWPITCLQPYGNFDLSYLPHDPLFLKRVSCNLYYCEMCACVSVISLYYVV